MLSGIRDFFRRSMSVPEDSEDAGDRRIRLAACALLLELAHADEDFSEDEAKHLTDAVRRQFGLPAEEAEELIRLAEAERLQAVDLWQFTSLIDEHYSVAQKEVLAEVMWGLLYSDGELADAESILMRRISNLLRLKPAFLSQARRRAREDLRMD